MIEGTASRRHCSTLRDELRNRLGRVRCPRAGRGVGARIVRESRPHRLCVSPRCGELMHAWATSDSPSTAATSDQSTWAPRPAAHRLDCDADTTTARSPLTRAEAACSSTLGRAVLRPGATAIEGHLLIMIKRCASAALGGTRATRPLPGPRRDTRRHRLRSRRTPRGRADPSGRGDQRAGVIT
jgi:hypothetical protein